MPTDIVVRDPAKRRRSRSKNRRVVKWRDRLPSGKAIGGACGRALRRTGPALIGLAAITAVCATAWFGYHWLTTSDRFAVEVIEVRGAERLSADRVRELSGVDIGDNVFLVDLGGVARSLESEPWISSATAKRELPHRIVVEITERTPAALVELGGLYLADADGLAFKRAAIERGEGQGLTVITGIAREDYLADETAAQAAIRAAHETAAEYERGQDRPALGEVHVDPRRGITLVTYATALSLRLGKTSDGALPQRLAAFDAAWGALDDQERAAARVIFMDNQTNPDRITVRFGGKN